MKLIAHWQPRGHTRAPSFKTVTVPADGTYDAYVISDPMVTRETALRRGFLTFAPLRTHALEREVPKMSRRRSPVASLVLSAFITLSMLVLPVRSAFADGQVLELPQVSSAAVASPTTSDDYLAPQTPVSRHRSNRQQVADETPPPGVGSLADYMHQSDEDSSPYPASAGAMSMSPAAVGFDTSGDRSATVNNVILGALALGLFAYEIHAAHQHHRR